MAAPDSADRRTVVAEFETALTRARSDDDAPGTLVLTAGPGTGKTHTLRALMPRLGSTVRFAGADELSWRQPFAVAVDLLGVDLPQPIPDGFADDLYARVDALCASGPVALIVDDAHHADAASLDLVFRLAGATRHLPLTLILGRRRLPERELLTRLLLRPGVSEWSLPPMSDAELELVAREFLGAAPDPALQSLLQTSGGNPMHAISMLRSLRQSGQLHVESGTATVEPEAGTATSSDTTEIIEGHLALLDADARALTQKLAVWGGPATLTDLADLDGTRAAALVGAAQTCIDAGILATDDAGALTFTHDLYAEVTYRRLAPALRTVLHDAVADHPSTRTKPQVIAHHAIAAGGDGPRVTAAVRRAESDLGATPAVAVDLLDSVATHHAPAAYGLHVDLATALARSGQLTRASQVAAEGLAIATDVDEMSQLLRIRLFALTTKGDTERARELIDETLRLPVGDDVAQALDDLRSYLGVLDGAAPVPQTPFFDVAREAETRSVPGLIGEGLRRFVLGDGDEALRLTLIASRRQDAEAESPVSANSSAYIWPPLVQNYAHGPAAAAALLSTVTGLRTRRGADWMTAFHEFTQGGIEFDLGHLDDAAATWNTGLERAASADLGWTSMVEGGQAMLEVLRGDLAAAANRLDDWERGGLPDQFGWPVTIAARALLLEATRKLRPAAETATTAWERAVSRRVYVWLPSVAVACARIGIRARDHDLLRSIVDGLDAMPHPPNQAAAGPVALARAMCTVTLDDADPASIVTAATRAADQVHDLGDVPAQAAALEEAACASALLGDKASARSSALRALTLTQGMSAQTATTRITSRLRPLGLRLDPTVVRERPRHGWESLTRTEVTVAELVAAGLSGAQIAERLFISTRTVQTHVSHALAKLGLRTRVELAAYVAGR